MYMIDLIEKKKQGQNLTKDELEFLVTGVTDSSIPDYQISALLMAIYFKGLNNEELFYLTKAMIASGDTIDLSLIKGFKVDKHSTGGIGDKTSLVLAPILASLGLKVTKMSGRGLGVTGGTIDKLETIPNFKTSLKISEFIDVINQVGMSIIGQSLDLVPADKKLYALRDVTSTSDSFPLIAASIMSKKLAMGADLIILDIKCGKGAFVHNITEAKELAKLMIDLGTSFKKRVLVIISDMNKPLGKTVGNSLELQEVVHSLQNKGPEDVKELVVNLGALALVGADMEKDLDQAKIKITKAFASPEPLKVFQSFISAQGGDKEYVLDLSKSQINAGTIIDIKADRTGYLTFTDNYLLGELSVLLGAGKTTQKDIIDPVAGIVLQKVQGDKVSSGDVIMKLYTNKPNKDHNNFLFLAQKTFNITPNKLENTPLILEIIM